MQAFIVANSQPLAPFRHPAADLKLHRTTLRHRLQTQLERAGYTVTEHQAGTALPPASLLVQDDMLVADDFFSALQAAIPDPDGRYQVYIDTSRYAVGFPHDAAPNFVAIPVYWNGDATSTELTPLHLKPEPVYQLVQGEQGIPAQVGTVAGLAMIFPDYFAIQIRYWFDFHTALGLYCREPTVRLIKRSRRWLSPALLKRLSGWRWFLSRTNRIGKNCRISPTAVIENCVIGDHVYIGPYAFVRGSIISDYAILRDHCSVQISYVGASAYISNSTVYNSYVGDQTYVSPPNLSNVIFGERGFIGGGSGFADFKAGHDTIHAQIGTDTHDSGLIFLGSGVGDDVFIGANMAFAPGRTIPSGTRLVDHSAIREVPQEADGTYVASGNRLIQIPASFIGA